VALGCEQFLFGVLVLLGREVLGVEAAGRRVGSVGGAQDPPALPPGLW
jgi:hypothetical protein